MKKAVLFAVVLFLVIPISLISQSAGDFRSAVTTGNWTGVGTWDSLATDLTTWITAVTQPTSAANVTIQNGHTITLDASGKSCKGLTVETGGTLLSSSAGNTLSINGNVQIDGTVGSSSIGVLTQFATSSTISGGGTFYFDRIRANNNGGIIVILNMNATGTHTGASVINCNNKDSFTFQVNAGKTLTLATGGYISVTSSSSTADPGTGANFTIENYGTIVAPITSGGGIGLANLPGFTSTLNVYNGGVITTGRLSALAAGTADANAININIFSGGSISVVGGNSLTNDMGKATLNVEGSFSTTSTISSNTIGNLIINNGSGITLSSPTTVTGTLTLTSGNITSTTSNLLTIGASGSVSGGSSSSFIDGPMAQTWSTSTSTKTYSIGKGSAYRPLEIALTTPVSPVIRAEMVNADAGGTSALDAISTVRYFQTSLVSGTATSGGTVKIFYDTDDGVQTSANLVVAQSSTANGSYTSLGSSATDASSVTSGTTYDPASGDFLILGSTSGNTLPVEIKSFSTRVNGKNIELLWNTATEVNNSGFEVERRAANNEWAKIAFVEGNGTSNTAHAYSYNDKAVSPATYHYRLKQIDRDGKFEYSTTVEATVAMTADDYQLSQNYPNPFNPTTTFTFAVNSSEQTTVKVFNIVGQEVATLFNSVAQANQLYTMQFDAKNLPSGIYFYTLRSQSRNEVKKMMLMK